MFGGTLFDLSFKMPILSFLWALLMLVVIAMLLAFALYFIIALAAQTGSILITSIIGLITIIAYIFLALYAPLDYVYTMGIDDAKKQ